MTQSDSIFGAELDRLKRLMTVGEEESDKDSNEHTSQTESVQALMERPGGQIDRYKLLSVLGEGGMGIVYLAEQQGSIHRRVALKVIKPGMDSKRVLARFDAERRTLALLDHPNIAHVYDAGMTKAGRPYFVMEHVKGLPITEHCDHYKLTIKQRLRLFQQICHSVHHAHQKGIIHRDIKPSNILVTIHEDQAIPKIIDFGVAKAVLQPLTDRTLYTEQGQLFGTPEYMSPEQADMASEDIDTRSDIYSLGVLLYELLTGVLPFDSETLHGGGIDQIRKVICETDPKTPSTRLTRLGEEAQKVAENRRTEIRTLAKHLKKELEWIPLKAMRKERSERYRSASELADDIENYLKGAPLLAGPPSNVYRLKKFVRRNRALVTGVAAVLTVLIAGIVVSTVLAIGQARAHAEAQLVTNFLNNSVLGSASKIKGREATVIDAFNEGITVLDEGRFRDQPLIEAGIRTKLAHTYYDLGQYAVAAQQQKITYDIYTQQLGRNSEDAILALNWLAVFYFYAGRYQEAEPLYRQIIEKAHHAKSGVLARYKLFWNANLGTTCAGLGRYEEAEQLLRPIIEADPSAGYGMHLGEIYREQGRYADAERILLESLDADRKKKDEKVQHYGGIVRCMHELGLLRLAQGRYEDAEKMFEQGMDVGARELPGKDHPFTLRHVNGLAIIRIKQKRYEEAKTLLERALEGRKLKLGDDHPNTIRTIHYLGILYREQGQFDKAEQFLIKSLKKREMILGEDHPHTLQTINDFGVLRREQKRYEEAETLLRQALDGRKLKLGENHPACFESMYELGVLYKEQARYEEAEQYLLEAVEGRSLKLGKPHPQTQESIKTLIALYEVLNKPEEAEKWRAELASGEDAEKQD